MSGGYLGALESHVRRSLDAANPRTSPARLDALKSSLIEYAALQRGLDVTRLTNRYVIVNPPFAKIPFLRMNGPRSSVVGKYLCDEKHHARWILQEAGLSVPVHRVFNPDEIESARTWAATVGFPVVIKPTNMSQGRGVTADVRDDDQLTGAWRKLRRMILVRRVREHGIDAAGRAIVEARHSLRSLKNFPLRPAALPLTRRILVEKHVSGNDYRTYVVGDDVVSVTQRKPANVVGNGRSTVLDLIANKNRTRAQNLYLSGYLIPTEIDKLDMLARSRRSVGYVPEDGEPVQLRSASNLSAGGDSIDLTDEASPGFKELAVNAVRTIPGMEYAGVDIIADDITDAPTASNHVVTELEYSPAPLAHFPLRGSPRDMAGAVLDYYLDRSGK